MKIGSYESGWRRLADSLPAQMRFYLSLLRGQNFSLNADLMLQAIEKALPVLLENRTGRERTVTKRRIMAGQYAHAALMCRKKDEMQALGYCFRSMLEWPLPDHGPDWHSRYKLLVAQLIRAAGLPPALVNWNNDSNYEGWRMVMRHLIVLFQSTTGASQPVLPQR